eukprot:46241_1
MPPKKEQKTKEQKLLAALAGSRKSKKKKWAKGRVKEKKNNNATLTPETYSSAIKEIPRMKCVTVATVSEKLTITGSLAHRLIRKLAKEGTLKKVHDSGGFLLYTKSEKYAKLQEELKAKREAEEAAKKKKGKGGKKKGGKKKGGG